MVQQDTIWTRNEATDPRYTKPFSKGGGFKGTSTNSTYIVKRLTEEFGPVGFGWGVNVVKDDMLTGAPIMNDKAVVLGHEIIHRVMIEFWWLNKDDGSSCRFHSFGQTQFVGRNKNGLFTDEEAPKKSLTDALTKAASWLGFAADVHLGMFDDNKYVSSRRDEVEALAPRRDLQYEPSKNARIEKAKSIIANGQTGPSHYHPELNGDYIPALDDDPLRRRMGQAISTCALVSNAEQLSRLEAKVRQLLVDLERDERDDLKTQLVEAMTFARQRVSPDDILDEIQDEFGLPQP